MSIVSIFKNITPLIRTLTPTQCKVQTLCFSDEPIKTTTTDSSVDKKNMITNKELSAEYKVSEYFGYNPHSYYDIETELIPHRMPQPSPY